MIPHFFSLENNETGGVRDAKEFKSALPINVNTSYASLAPCIAIAEQKYIVSVLGSALFDALADAYRDSGGDSGDAVIDEAVHMIQFALIRIALWDSFDTLAVTFSDRGANVNAGEKRMYRYESDNLRASFRRQGFDQLNTLLSYLEANIDKFPDFISSEYYSVNVTSMIRNAIEFDSIIHIDRSFLVYRRMREYIRLTESLELPHRLGSSLAAAVMANREATRFTPILRGLQEFVVCHSMADAALTLNILPTDEGFVSLSDAGTDGKVANAPDLERLEKMGNYYRQRADRYIASVINFCKRNIATYPELSEIGGADAVEDTVVRIDNTGSSMFMA